MVVSQFRASQSINLDYDELPPLTKSHNTSSSISKVAVYSNSCPLSSFTKIFIPQSLNVPVAVDVLNKQGFVINENALREGIENVISQTGLLGRWQILSKNPLVIADTGHNEVGIKEVLEQIKNTPHEKLHFVLGVVNDKDVSSILNMLPKNATYYFCQAKIPRALSVEELKQKANEFKLIGHSYTSVSEALSQAKLSAGKDDLVFVGGSTFTVAEVV